MDDDKWIGPAPGDTRDRKEKIDSWWWRNKKRVKNWLAILAPTAVIIGVILRFFI